MNVGGTRVFRVAVLALGAAVCLTGCRRGTVKLDPGIVYHTPNWPALTERPAVRCRAPVAREVTHSYATWVHGDVFFSGDSGRLAELRAYTPTHDADEVLARAGARFAPADIASTVAHTQHLRSMTAQDLVGTGGGLAMAGVAASAAVRIANAQAAHEKEVLGFIERVKQDTGCIGPGAPAGSTLHLEIHFYFKQWRNWTQAQGLFATIAHLREGNRTLRAAQGFRRRIVRPIPEVPDPPDGYMVHPPDIPPGHPSADAMNLVLFVMNKAIEKLCAAREHLDAGPPAPASPAL